MELTIELTRETTKEQLNRLIDDIMERYNPLYVELLDYDGETVTVDITWSNKKLFATVDDLEYYFANQLADTSELDLIETQFETKVPGTVTTAKEIALSVLSEYVHSWILEGE